MRIIQRLFEVQELEMGPKAESPETRQAIETLRKEIPEQILGHYDRLRGRGKKGVALVRHGVCSGCQMKLASGIHAQLYRDDDIGVCDTCGRYLLLAPEEAPGGKAPGEPPASPPPPVTKRGRRKAVAADAAA
jgi:predicted  nucleic acid-binding Zn-ribbon protein